MTNPTNSSRPGTPKNKPAKESQASTLNKPTMESRPTTPRNKLTKPNPATTPSKKTEVIPRVISIYTCGCRIEDERPTLSKIKTSLIDMAKGDNAEPPVERELGIRCERHAALGWLE